jgi:hypothetical protein
MMSDKGVASQCKIIQCYFKPFHKIYLHHTQPSDVLVISITASIFPGILRRVGRMTFGVI